MHTFSCYKNQLLEDTLQPESY